MISETKKNKKKVTENYLTFTCTDVKLSMMIIIDNVDDNDIDDEIPTNRNFKNILTLGTNLSCCKKKANQKK